MLHFLRKWVFFISFFIGFPVIANEFPKESHLIRRLYLELLDCPPTPGELEWLLVYTVEPYVSAVNWILYKNEKYNNESFRTYLLSSCYKEKPLNELSSKKIDYIIQYQIGKRHLSVEEASRVFVELAIKLKGSNVLDVIDYMCVCLMARETNVKEANILLAEFRTHSNEIDGYIAVLERIKRFEDVIKY